MKNFILLMLVVLIFHSTNVSATSDLPPSSTAPNLTQVSIQYKWFDSAENRSKGIAPTHFTSNQKTATNKPQKLWFSLYFDTSKSVNAILDYIKTTLGVKTDELKVRLGIARKDRVIDIPLARMQHFRMIKVRHFPQKQEELD